MVICSPGIHYRTLWVFSIFGHQYAYSFPAQCSDARGSRLQLVNPESDMGEDGEEAQDVDHSPADWTNSRTCDLPDDDIQMPTPDGEENIVGDLDDDFGTADFDVDASDGESWTEGESDIDL
ncbi:unnamed protein product [Peniophora sp. CBMAI 1063]|nr:unnamed protein product [Peniophora sp. CBMAI 1063]